MTDPLTLYRLFERGRTIGSGRHVKCFGVEQTLTELSYDQFSQDVIALASLLRDRGLKPGQRVATLASNGIRHLQLMWAVPLAGGVFHAINTRLSTSEIDFILQDADDRILFIDQEFGNLLTEVGNSCPNLDIIFLGDDINGEVICLESLLRTGVQIPETIERVVTDEDTPAVLCYTSGTTGRPKGVNYSHRALTLHALTEAMVDGYAISNCDHVLLMVPFCHGAGWGVPYAAFMCGANISVISGPVQADHVMEILSEEQITFAAAVPEVIARIASNIAAKNSNFSGLRILMGGTVPRSETLKILGKADITSMLCWGMTETLSAATMLHLPPNTNKTTITQGQPLPLTELSLSEGAKGLKEVFVRGPCVVQKYHGHDTSARQDGWFATGDLAEIDNDGTLHVQDRKKDLIKSGGEWISPASLEDVISQIEGVNECAVVGVPHPKWGERPLCLITVFEKIETEQIFQSLVSMDRFAKWQIPDEFIILDELPRTTLGKLDRQALRLKFKSHFLRDTI